MMTSCEVDEAEAGLGSVSAVFLSALVFSARVWTTRGDFVLRCLSSPWILDTGEYVSSTSVKAFPRLTPSV